MRKQSALRSDYGSVLPVTLGLAIAILVLAILVMPSALGITSRANSQTAADAAAIAGGRELRSQIVHGDHTQSLENLDLNAICSAAADYAGRNDATVVSGGCDVGLADGHFTVTVDVQSGEAVEIRPSEEPDPEDPDAEFDDGVYEYTYANARAQVDPGQFSGQAPGGGGSWEGQPDLLDDAPETVEERFVQLVEYAQAVDELDLVYEWGGGHCCTPAEPKWGPFDCSGAVSAAMQYGAGYDVHTAVSGQMVSAGVAGASPSGKGVTLYAYDGHVFMVIGGRGWGTGSAPNGGAGWLSYNTPYHGQFVGRHFPEFEELDPDWVDEVLEGITGESDSPTDPGADGFDLGTAADVRLVPVN